MTTLTILAILIVVILISIAAMLPRLFRRSRRESHIKQIQGTLANEIEKSETEEDHAEFPSETTVIYLLKLDRAEGLVAETRELKRLELSLSNRMFYVVDSDPLGLLEKPLALAIFSDDKLEQFIRLASHFLPSQADTTVCIFKSAKKIKANQGKQRQADQRDQE